MHVCDDISVCRRRVCMCVMIFQCVGGDCMCDDTMLVYCVCSHMTGAIWRTSSPFPIDKLDFLQMVRLSVL